MQIAPVALAELQHFIVSRAGSLPASTAFLAWRESPLFSLAIFQFLPSYFPRKNSGYIYPCIVCIDLCMLNMGASPRDIDACPRYMDACPRNIDASPRNIDASPRYIDACPRYIDACPRNIDACPRTIDASPRYIDACIVYMEACTN